MEPLAVVVLGEGGWVALKRPIVQSCGKSGVYVEYMLLGYVNGWEAGTDSDLDTMVDRLAAITCVHGVSCSQYLTPKFLCS